MFLRDFIGKLLVSLTFGLLFIGGVIADCWLLWDKDKQELWDKIAGTVVVNDPERRALVVVPAEWIISALGYACWPGETATMSVIVPVFA